MVYKPNIPVPSDPPIQSQPQITTNFGELDSQFGTEHTAFSAVANNGKHKYVTLQRSAGVAPGATDFVLSQAVTPGGNPYLQCNDNLRIQSVPLVKTVTGPIANGQHTIFDFAAAPAMIPQMGTLLIMDPSTGTRNIFTYFTWDGAALQIPGTSNQLISGSSFTRFDKAGSALKLTNTAAATTFVLKITGSAT